MTTDLIEVVSLQAHYSIGVFPMALSGSIEKTRFGRRPHVCGVCMKWEEWDRTRTDDYLVICIGTV